MRKTAIITGVTGQTGSYLAETLLEKDYEVFGIKRRTSVINTKNIDHLFNHPRFHLNYGDVIDSVSLFRMVHDIQPDEIYNLAAQSHVKVSFENPEYTLESITLGTLRLLESIRTLKLVDKTKFYQASTSELFGNAKAPQSETTPFCPQSPYACAKLYSFWLTKNYREGYNIHATNGILFNHESPRRGETFVTRKVIKAAVDIVNGRQEFLEIGNINAKRDWSHAKDFAYNIWKMLQCEIPSDYILASGESYSVAEFIQKVFKAVGINLIWKLNKDGKWQASGFINGVEKVLVKQNFKYLRPNEVHHLQGDCTRAEHYIGIERKYTLDSMIKEMIEHEQKTS